MLAEKMVLGSILKNEANYEKLILEPKNFKDEAHQRIFEAMTELYEADNLIDKVTVSNKLRLNYGNDYQEYLSQLYNEATDTTKVLNYEQIIFADYRDRASHDLIKEYNNDRNDKNMEKLILDLENLKTIGIKDQRKTTNENLKEIAQEMLDGKNPLEDGYKTGMTELDKITGGMGKGRFIVVGARPSMAKSAFVLNIALKVSADGGTPHIMTYEMSTTDILKRMISTTGNVSGDVWLANDMNAEQYRNAINAIGQLSEQEIEIYEYIYKVRRMKAIIREAIETDPEGRHMLIVDGVNFLEAENNHQNKTSQIEEVSQALQSIAREFDIPVILVSQLNRGVEQRDNKRPLMSDLKESGALEQLADIVILLYRDEYYYHDTEQKGIVEINLAKHRQGAKATIEMVFKEEYGKFLNLDFKPID